MKERPVRKNIRLKGYDYSRTGAYFVTICVKDKHELLGEVVGAATCRPYVVLSEYGAIIKSSIQKIPSIYGSVQVERYVIMPNHIHMMIRISDHGRQIAAPTVSLIVSNMKRAVSMQTGFSLWQKSFHDHIIRTEEEYHRICRYIDENPARWPEDEYYAI